MKQQLTAGLCKRQIAKFVEHDEVHGDEVFDKPALAEMYVTRKVKAITEELCGHSFSATSISAINRRLDEARRNLPGARWPRRLLI